MKTKYSIVLAVLLALSLFISCNSDTPTSDADIWDGTTDTSWYNTTDTEFTISTAEQLAGLAAIVNNTASGITADTFKGKTIYLSENIDLNNREWTPIGDGKSDNINSVFAPHYFYGKFDGNNKTISNLKISSSEDTLGLFGTIWDGSVCNLVIENANIKGAVAESPTVGGVVGVYYATYEAGSLSNLTVTDSSIFSSDEAGGIVGTVYSINKLAADNTTTIYAIATLTGCTVIDTSISSSWLSGGIVARATDGQITISDCHVSLTKYNTYIEATGSSTNAGGIAGRMIPNSGSITSSTVTLQNGAAIRSNTASGIASHTYNTTISGNTVTTADDSDISGTDKTYKIGPYGDDYKSSGSYIVNDYTGGNIYNGITYTTGN